MLNHEACGAVTPISQAQNDDALFFTGPINKQPARAGCRHHRRTVGQDRQKCKETSNLDVIVTDTSSPLADKQQKTGEYVENIKFS